MRLNEIEARMAELDNIVSNSEDIEEVKKAVEERKALESEKATLIEEAKKEEERQAQEEAEKRAADAALLSHNPGLATIIEEKRGGRAYDRVDSFRNHCSPAYERSRFICSGSDRQLPLRIYPEPGTRRRYRGYTGTFICCARSDRQLRFGTGYLQACTSCGIYVEHIPGLISLSESDSLFYR